MATTLTSKGQITIPKHIRDALQLQPGAAVAFSVNAAGGVVLQPNRPKRCPTRRPAKDRFDVLQDDPVWSGWSIGSLGVRAAVEGWPLLTRAARRFQRCFPPLEVLPP